MSRAPSIAARRCASVASTVPTRARRTNRARGAAASRNADAETNAETDDRRDSRRAFLARACAGTACARASSSQASEARAPSGYDAPTVAPSGSTTRANAFESSRAGGESISPYAYRLRWPSGWCALRDLASARTVGVDASFKDPLDEASTLAVFVTRGVRERDVASRYGTLDEDARRRADAAPNQKTIGKRIVRVSVPRGGRRRSRRRRGARDRNRSRRRHRRQVRRRRRAHPRLGSGRLRVVRSRHGEQIRVAARSRRASSRRR